MRGLKAIYALKITTPLQNIECNALTLIEIALPDFLKMIIYWHLNHLLAAEKINFVLKMSRLAENLASEKALLGNFIKHMAITT